MPIQGDTVQRESMEFDVVIVGAGPSGLSAACRIMQLAQERDREMTVCVVEKGSEVGAHILSGAVLEPRALDELFPNWQDMGAPLQTKVAADRFLFYTSEKSATTLPNFLIPKPTHNDGNYIVSMGNVCRWLAEQAESLGVEIYPGFAAGEILYGEDGSVRGIATGDMGIAADGGQKDSYMQGMELHARYTLFAEGCRGHLGKQLIEKFGLDEGRDPQHYGIGIKEIWEIPAEQHEPGLVVHGLGWPLKESGSSGGAFLYHAADNQVYLGLITDLNYSNPHVSPFEEFQRWKQHPETRRYIEGGTRLSYGARAIAKGGLNSLPRMQFPGGLLIGCDAGTLNSVKIKGNHTAMKSGLLAAEAIVDALGSDSPPAQLDSYESAVRDSWLHEELYTTRNFSGWMHKFGFLLGSAMVWIDQTLFRGRMPFTLHDREADHAALKPAADSPKIEYPKPDNVISFDRLSSVFLSNTNHEEDQPCHLTLRDSTVPISSNLPLYDEPAQRYCPAGVYEIVEEEDGGKRFQINAQNCVHCKTCDIKDPAQNIVWVAPEGFGGPNYPNM
jgi:electron-transferring-flavoprotein dehydrogenase